MTEYQSNRLEAISLDRASNPDERAVSTSCYWLTGLPGAGKTTLAREFSLSLRSRQISALVLDGDDLRAGLNRDLTYNRDDRAENIRRVSEIARILIESDITAIVALVSPYQEDRDMARQIIGPDRFVEVFVDAPIDTCMERDPKGLYQRARTGLLPNFTGVTAPYEKPTAPTVHVPTSVRTVAESIDILLNHFEHRRERTSRSITDSWPVPIRA
ncbi:adenylyl-sulfate kinase [Burkholderia sp. BCC1977]|uniref:adenylyl-sulfate kinase n=1 Tax=Burkholderia sp. BCC1977 TaxID=2817440 RepID=UPI002ABE3F31|nr:adenylyl-sulfate kinase [Burkholderia sp. BCC1977]